MTSAQPLKHLQVRKSQLEGELSQLGKTARDLQKQINDKTEALKIITREIQEISNSKPIVSEHALLRYCERILNIDLKKIETELLSEKNLKLIEQFRSGKFPCEGYRIVVKNKVILTVEP